MLRVADSVSKVWSVSFGFPSGCSRRGRLILVDLGRGAHWGHRRAGFIPCPPRQGPELNVALVGHGAMMVAHLTIHTPHCLESVLKKISSKG